MVGVALPLVVVAALVAGCGSAATTRSVASKATKATSATVQNVPIKIAGGKLSKKLGYTTPDGNGHDTFIPADLNVKVGETVRVTISNYDEGPHTFTSPDIGVNQAIPGAKNATKGIPSVTTFTFVVKKAGKFRWYCTLPCDKKAKGWAMSADKTGPARDGYMAGYVTAS